MAFVPETDTLIFTEGIGTPGTTVEWTASELLIEDVQLEVINPDPDSSPLEELTGLTITFSGASFTFAATFATWFSRRVTFVVEEGVVDNNMTYSFNNQVSRPSLLPDSFYAAHRVESPPPFLTLVFTITGTETTVVEGDEEGGIPPSSTSGPFEEQWVCTVRHDYGANIIAVREAVQKGDAFKRYEEQ
jgi:hypothetical protein